MISSIGVEVAPLTNISVLAAPAARATPHSPSRWPMASCPHEERPTGIEISWPQTVVRRSRAGYHLATCGRNSTCSNAARLARVVTSEPLPPS